MKTLFRCVDCDSYSLHSKNCNSCGGKLIHPYPARFSLVKEKKFRRLYRN